MKENRSYEGYRDTSKAWLVGFYRGDSVPSFKIGCNLYDIRALHDCLVDLANCKYDYLVIELENVYQPEIF